MSLGPILGPMAEERPSERSTPVCRWRSSAETLDVIEALERIEALLLRLDARLGWIAEPARPIPDREPVRRQIP